MLMDSPLKKAIENAGGVAALARALNVTSQAISQWDRVPAERVIQVEVVTGVTRYDLRPDVFGPAPCHRQGQERDHPRGDA